MKSEQKTNQNDFAAADNQTSMDTLEAIEFIDRKLRMMDEKKVKCILQFVIHIAG